jgi:hypothetical protein
MSLYVCTLLTDEGSFYIAYSNIVDQFISRAGKDIRPAAKIVERGIKESRDDAARNVFDMRSMSIERYLAHVSKLKLGKRLNDKEAEETRSFVKFLKGNVAPHQKHKYPELTDSAIDQWFEEIGTKGRFSNMDWWETVSEATYDTLYGGRKNRSADNRMVANKISGRYIEALARIAHLMGDGCDKPCAVVDRFYKILAFGTKNEKLN